VEKKSCTQPRGVQNRVNKKNYQQRRPEVVRQCQQADGSRAENSAFSARKLMLPLHSCPDRSGVPTSDVLQECEPGRDGDQQDNHQHRLHGQRTHPGARPLCRHRRSVHSKTEFKSCFLNPFYKSYSP
jgi:hypothetical protein